MRLIIRFALCIVLLLFAIHFSLFTANAEDNPLNLMRDDVLSYFKPLKGTIKSISDGKAVADINIKAGAKKGMRLTVFREGAPFVHPVTKEPLGKLETTIGKVDVKDAGTDTSALTIIRGDVKESDKVRISENKIRMLYYPSKNVEWSLADSYYRALKETGRFELIDTALETENESEIIAEAKRLNAEVILMVSAKDAGSGNTLFKQSILWVEDSVKFAEEEVKIAGTFLKELKFGEELFGLHKGAAQQYMDLPYGVSLLAAGDIDGDGNAELLMSTGNDIRLYVPSGELNDILEIKGGATDSHIWLDTMDINGNGRAEVMVTLLKSNSVVSRIYELTAGKFSMLWEGNVFLRRMGNELIAQEYAQGEGFKGGVFAFLWDKGLKKGNVVNLPKDVNIYDFAYVSTLDGKKLVLAYDENGRLNLYDDAGIKLWQSKDDYGGFNTTFKRSSPSAWVDRGEWSVKDRLSLNNREAFVIKRIPFIAMIRNLGYSKSKILSLWWTGFSMEEREITEDISGNIIDYTIAGDKLIVLSKPAFGIKFGNILKGENPLGTMLYIFSLKGR